MNRRPFAAALLLIASSAANSSCLFKKKAKAAPPVIAAPPSTRTPPAEPPNVPPPPSIKTPESAETLPAPAIDTPVPVRPRVKPEPPRRARRPPSARPPQSTASQPAGEPAETEPAPPVPALTQLLTPAEKQAYNQAIDAALKSARAKLVSLQSRRLDATQRASLERASAIAKQAEEARATDLATSKALAERADILAENLLRGSQ